MWCLVTSETNQQKQTASSLPVSDGLLFILFLNSEDGGDIFLRNVGFPQSKGARTQKTVLIIERKLFASLTNMLTCLNTIQKVNLSAWV
jgi:hypothetical protein